jgi:voltage-gated sodium channel
MAVADPFYNLLMISCIVLAGVLVGVVSYPSYANNMVLNALDIIIQTVFTVDIVLKLGQEGVAPQGFFIGPERAWNNFDLALVIVLWIPIPGGVNVAFLRLLRLARLLKLVNKVKQLQVIVMGLARGLGSCTYIVMLLLLIFYLFAIVGCVCFRRNDPYHWGGVGIAMLTLFRIATFEAWTVILFLNYYGCDSQNYSVAGVSARFPRDSAIAKHSCRGVVCAGRSRPFSP